MDTIDVSDLPEPFAQAVKAVAETFRRQLASDVGKDDKAPSHPSPIEFPRRKLGVIGTLSREEIYDDRV
ncbi:hypothetical protein TA3x_000304 [Tundrisphaera sp. TA3]|uniref:hypothetical protein n=1 Tax=Tundrisphaera sp. TA3 TaxID=3435775 RepID=UPI003EBC064F